MNTRKEKWRVSHIKYHSGKNARIRYWSDVVVYYNSMMPELPPYKRENRRSWLAVAFARKYERAESMRILTGRERADRLQKIIILRNKVLSMIK